MRKDDPKNAEPQAQTDRIFVVGEGYWFRTRENELQGPFHTIKEAYSGLIRYIEMVEERDGTTGESRPRPTPVADPNIWNRAKN